MENGQMPPIQPMSPMQPAYPSMQPGMTPNGMPMIQQVQVEPEKHKDVAGIIKIIVIIALALALVTFIGLFIWMYLQYNEAQSDLDAKINVAAAEAKDEQAEKDEEEFLNREKYPYKTFSGPTDYGQLTFEYPKTWSVYIAETAAEGGNFAAYLNPGQVVAPVDETVNALRVKITNENFDDVVAGFQSDVEDDDANLDVTSITINGTAANRYEGIIPGTELNGIFVIIKIRDKTVMLQTDSVLFKDDFNKLVETITFNA